jgi:D-3-phosphoglycerate dehydrogenase
MEAWRTSCPGLPIWEEANERGFIERHREPGRGAVVVVSARGVQYLSHHRAATEQAALVIRGD